MLIVDIGYIDYIRSGWRIVGTHLTSGNIKTQIQTREQHHNFHQWPNYILQLLKKPAPFWIPHISSQMYSLCIVSYFKIKTVSWNSLHPCIYVLEFVGYTLLYTKLTNFILKGIHVYRIRGFVPNDAIRYSIIWHIYNIRFQITLLES